MRKALIGLAVAALSVILPLSLAVAADQTAPVTKAATTTKATTKTATKVELVDINSATEEQLVGLGLTKELAKKIIDNRPYAMKNQLTSKKILTADEYKKVSDKIVAKQAPKAATTTVPATKK